MSGRCDHCSDVGSEMYCESCAIGHSISIQKENAELKQRLEQLQLGWNSDCELLGKDRLELLEIEAKCERQQRAINFLTNYLTQPTALACGKKIKMSVIEKADSILRGDDK